MTWNEPTRSLKLTMTSEIYGNTLLDFSIALAMFLAIFYALVLFKRIAGARLRMAAEKTTSDFDDFLVSLIHQIGYPVFATAALYLSSRSLALNPPIHKVILILLAAAVTYRMVRMIQATISYALAKTYIKDATADPGRTATLKMMTAVLNWVIFAVGVIFLLDNLGVNVSAVIAGLGIGGVAVALAAQAVLGDLFASLAIFLDKPFQVGDFIIVGDLKGTVEHIGIKTTRLRSLDGELLIFSNADLTASRIRNFKQMSERRVIFTFGVVYQTTLDQLKTIPRIVKEILAGTEGVRTDRVHFKSFGDSSLDFEVVYFVKNPDYNIYMDCQERINLKLVEEFQKAGVEFAYPTRTLYIEKQTEPA